MEGSVCVRVCVCVCVCVSSWCKVLKSREFFLSVAKLLSFLTPDCFYSDETGLNPLREFLFTEGKIFKYSCHTTEFDEEDEPN